MINASYKQGTFKKWDDIVVIDPLYPNNWKVISILDNYGTHRDINSIILYKSGEEYAKTIKMDTQYVDMFFDVYKIVKEY